MPAVDSALASLCSLEAERSTGQACGIQIKKANPFGLARFCFAELVDSLSCSLLL